MAAVMIRLEDRARDTVAKLAREQNTTIATVVDKAIERAGVGEVFMVDFGEPVGHERDFDARL